MPERPSAMRRARSAVLAAGAAMALSASLPAAARACSPPFGGPSIDALDEGAVVLVGTTGDRVPGGRAFFVERVYAGDVTSSPIVIAFQEGEPVGDCSYPVAAGTHLVIAPEVAPDGTLSANLATLQADPDSDVGRRLILEARARYGDGSIPSVVAQQREPREARATDLLVPAVVIGLGVGILALVVLIAWRRTRTGGDPRPGF